MRFSTFAITAFAASVTAQSASQIAQCDALAAQVPACVIPCDDAGFKAVGCTAEDYACHCTNAAKLTEIIPSCLKNSTCSTTDLQTFSTIPAQICAVLSNSTASINSTSGANSTSTTTSLTGYGSATATPSGPKGSGSVTGSGAGSSSTATGGAGALNVASTVFTVAGMGILGFFL
ncbi:Polyphosphoinositide phosphatase [Venturia nashicola]|uniref:Polyphosphoinositide phosphatase n=1 Tax=Venturia nashicola TaxID=86259 RepID=A0A4Z1PBC8_9PEZI|nr:Polyphosphoinositide phosphatase [Venturia nashicola]TLD37795.1 Polyphosphoinositide phosphatase [Venturia nashicola]